MHNGPALAQAVTTCRPHAVTYRGLAYRAIHLRHFASFVKAQPLFAAAGGPTRYVPPGGPAALYVAFDLETGNREFNQKFYRVAGGPFGTALLTSGALRPDPAAVIGVHLDVSHLLDLRLPAVLQLLNTNNGELLLPWGTVPNPTDTQRLGAAIYADGWFEGIVYPSAQHLGRHCAVLFPQRFVANPAVHFRGFQVGPTPNPQSDLADARRP